MRCCILLIIRRRDWSGLCGLRHFRRDGGWSFQELLRNPANGNAGLAPAAVAASGSARVSAIDGDCCGAGSVRMFLSFTLESPDQAGAACRIATSVARPVCSAANSTGLTGQCSFGVIRCQVLCLRGRYRISVKVELNGGGRGCGCGSMCTRGDKLEVSSPRGKFCFGVCVFCRAGQGPVVLVSAGDWGDACAGDAVCRWAAEGKSTRGRLLWVHAARDLGAHHPFAGEVGRRGGAGGWGPGGGGAGAAGGAATFVTSRPGPLDQLGSDFDSAGAFDPLGFWRSWVFRERQMFICVGRIGSSRI